MSNSDQSMEKSTHTEAILFLGIVLAFISLGHPDKTISTINYFAASACLLIFGIADVLVDPEKDEA